MADKVLELLKQSKNTLVSEIAKLAIETNRSFSETAKEYNKTMIRNKFSK